MASTRFPGKPLIKIDGIPMIQRVWQQAIKSKLGEVYVACSENEVYDLISSLGGHLFSSIFAADKICFTSLSWSSVFKIAN